MNRFAAFFAAAAIALAQNPAARPGPAPGAVPSAVIRIDVNLVQVDAVVTTSSGRRVSDLQAADFRILQDGKPQDITNFSYVSTKPAATAAVPRAAPAKPVKGEAPPPPAPIEPAEVRRTLALLVDEQGLAAENIPAVRTAIRGFIDQQMRPGDLVAIVRTGAGMGSLQQFTSDKRLLYAALERVKYGESRVGIGSFAPLGSGTRGTANLDHLREDTLAVGSLGAIRFVVNAMRGYPGRKSVILFTENIRMIYRRATDELVSDAVQRLSDAASRASVVIHAIDPRGMQDYNITAVDDTSHVSSRRAARVPAQREQEVFQTQQGMFVLAEETGGLFLQNTNDLAGALRKAAEDSDGYYLIGYHPDADSFENKNGQPKFHKIDVLVKKAGLHVRTRDGFFGEPGGAGLLQHTREAELTQALQSPTAAGAIHPRLTAVFAHRPQTGLSIDGLLSFDPGELQWSSEPDGSHKARLDLAAAAYDENGLALAPVDTTFTLQLNAAQYAGALQKGMVYGIRFPVKRPGPYLLRAALRDAATEGSGSVQQYVEVPDLESGHLALSGIAMREAAALAAHGANAAVAQGPGPVEDSTGGAARRSFRPGALLEYGCEIFNAKRDAGQHPDVVVQARVFHGGEQVLTGRMTLEPGSAAEPQRLAAGGRVTLGRDLTPGVYVLQVVITDKLARSKFTTATQSMDFEIAP
jgi:VWFA-related protein